MRLDPDFASFLHRRPTLCHRGILTLLRISCVSELHPEFAYHVFTLVMASAVTR